MNNNIDLSKASISPDKEVVEKPLLNFKQEVFLGGIALIIGFSLIGLSGLILYIVK